MLIFNASGTFGSSTISPSGPTPSVIISKVIQIRHSYLLLFESLSLFSSVKLEVSSKLLQERIIIVNNK